MKGTLIIKIEKQSTMKHNKMILHLTQFAVIVYTIIAGDDLAQKLALFTVPIWIAVVWRKCFDKSN